MKPGARACVAVDRNCLRGFARVRSTSGNRSKANYFLSLLLPAMTMASSAGQAGSIVSAMSTCSLCSSTMLPQSRFRQRHDGEAVHLIQRLQSYELEFKDARLVEMRFPEGRPPLWPVVVGGAAGRGRYSPPLRRMRVRVHSLQSTHVVEALAHDQLMKGSS